jgi:hypothetical protein
MEWSKEECNSSFKFHLIVKGISWNRDQGKITISKIYFKPVLTYSAQMWILQRETSNGHEILEKYSGNNKKG